jgi:hypothetical protein
MLLVALAQLFCCCAALPVFVQGTAKLEGFIAAGACLDMSFAAPVTAGNRIIVALDFVTSPPVPIPVTVRDTAGSVYDIVTSITNSETFGQAVFSAVAAAPFTKVSICHSVSCAAWTWNIFEYRDAAIGNSGASANFTAPAGAFTGTPINVVCSDAVVMAFEATVGGSASPAPGPLVRAQAGGNFVVEVPASNGAGLYTASGTLEPGSNGWSMSLVELRGSACSQPVTPNIAAGQTVLIQGDAAVATQTEIGGTLIVTGNLTIANASVALQGASVVNVGGNANVASPLSVQQGATFAINGTLNIAPGSTVSTVWTNIAGNAATMTIASFTSMSGSFQFAPPVLAGSTLPACAQVSPVTANVGSTALTVSVSINTVLCGTTAGGSGSGSGLSTAAIIGIAVAGGVVVVAAVVLTTVLIVRSVRSKNEWAAVQKKLGGGGVGTAQYHELR